ncbi:DUF1120 domain-containing protein [Pseudomonas fluorescens]|uniref:DUF1120 domain-containing protein n=1 Tax=Pseudomonas fluorescens TaxID=294 RepID=UPI001913867F|nr:DUF1120 domain-containing protein [Pseudomonas fluorescens]
MNINLTCCAAVLLCAVAAHANAASSTDLSVTGTITPAACTPQLSNGGVIDYGKISVKDLAATTQLPPVTVQMSVSCDAATFFAVNIQDNRENTVGGINPSRSYFGLGLGENDHKIGWYMLKMNNALADGEALPVVESVNGQTWFPASDGTVWQPGWMRSVSGPGSPDYAPVSMQMLVANLVVASTLYKPKVITQEMPIDGSATLDIVYL